MSNILPQKQISKLKRLYRKRYMVVVFISVTILFLAGVAFIAPSLYYAHKDEQALAAKKAQLDTLQTGTYRESLQVSINDINAKLATFNNTEPQSPVVNSFLNIVLASKTPAIHILALHLSVDPKNANSAQVEVRGTADSREALLYFADTLRGHDGFSNVDVPIDTFIKNSNVPFALTADVSLK